MKNVLEKINSLQDKYPDLSIMRLISSAIQVHSVTSDKNMEDITDDELMEAIEDYEGLCLIFSSPDENHRWMG